MNGIPKYLVLPDRVYALTAEKADGGRAFERMLVDYLVEGTNPVSESDTWRTLQDHLAALLSGSVTEK